MPRTVPQPPDQQTLDALAVMGAHLRRERTRKELTQEQAAEGLGIDSKYLAKIERGQVNVTVGTLIKLAEFYGVPASRLLRPGKVERQKVGRPKKRI
jgi:transcriptional regulator with XRE-family HTH domain